jgi:hypothetical protein
VFRLYCKTEKAGLFPKIGLMAGVIRNATGEAPPAGPRTRKSSIYGMAGQRDLHNVAVALHQLQELGEIAGLPKLSRRFAGASMGRLVGVDSRWDMHHQNDLVPRDLGAIKLPGEPANFGVPFIPRVRLKNGMGTGPQYGVKN